jgi:hypothetical protein
MTQQRSTLTHKTRRAVVRGPQTAGDPRASQPDSNLRKPKGFAEGGNV